MIADDREVWQRLRPTIGSVVYAIDESNPGMVKIGGCKICRGCFFLELGVEGCGGGQSPVAADLGSVERRGGRSVDARTALGSLPCQ